MQERVHGRPEEAVGGTGGEREGERAQGRDGAAETQGDILGAVCSPLLGGRLNLARGDILELCGLFNYHSFFVRLTFYTFNGSDWHTS